MIHDASKLRKLISENPDLPIVVLASEEANRGEWSWQYCSDVDCSIVEILDVKTPFDRGEGHIFDDKGDFEEAIMDTLCDLEPYKSMSDDKYQEAAGYQMGLYADKWRRAIAIYASN